MLIRGIKYSTTDGRVLGKFRYCEESDWGEVTVFFKPVKDSDKAYLKCRGGKCDGLIPLDRGYVKETRIKFLEKLGTLLVKYMKVRGLGKILKDT